MRLDEATYTVFDVETTGLFPYHGDRICEIGAVKVAPGGKKETFERLIDPQRPISSGAFAVNQITRDMLDGKPLIDDVLPEFMEFAKGTVLVAYNAGFDMGFIECALGHKAYSLNDFDVVDVLALARNLFPGVRRYNLVLVAGHIGVDTERKHRALADACMTAEVFKKELEILRTQGIKTVGEIAQKHEIKVSIPGARHAGMLKTIEDAMRQEKPLNIVYHSAWGNSVSERMITPKEVRRSYDRTYVVAYCHAKKDIRNFRLDCIKSATSA